MKQRMKKKQGEEQSKMRYEAIRIEGHTNQTSKLKNKITLGEVNCETKHWKTEMKRLKEAYEKKWLGKGRSVSWKIGS